MDHPNLDRLVLKLAHRYKWCGAPLEDLIAEGHLGVAVAKERFDPDRGVKFITYAHHWIRGKVQKCADKWIRTHKDTSSLDIQNENGRSRLDTLAAEAAPAAEDSELSSMHSEAIAHLLAALSADEAVFMSRRYGLHSHPAPSAHRREVRASEAEIIRSLRLA
jgi:RNA polymerase sigma factor (sigma-70 family)